MFIQNRLSPDEEIVIDALLTAIARQLQATTTPFERGNVDSSFSILMAIN